MHLHSPNLKMYTIIRKKSYIHNLRTLGLRMYTLNRELRKDYGTIAIVPNITTAAHHNAFIFLNCHDNHSQFSTTDAYKNFGSKTANCYTSHTNFAWYSL